MINAILEDDTFKDIMNIQIKQIIQYLLDNNIEFGITVKTKAVDFKPQLPEPIYSKLGEFSVFHLAKYTYTTIKLDDQYITFEAGFGEENFGSICTMPLCSIFQIIIDNSLLHINPVATVDKCFTEQKEDKSLKAFLNNPKNKKFNM